MSVAVKDPAAWLRDQRRAEAAAPKPPADRKYEHGTECPNRNAGPPPWVLADEDTGTWRRQCDQGHCGTVQYHSPKVPAPPPRPEGELLARWEHSHQTTAEDGRTRTALPCPNVAPVIDVKLVRDDGDRGRRGLVHWMATCQLCSNVKHWHAEAAEHYREHGGELPPERPSVFTLADLPRGPRPVD